MSWWVCRREKVWYDTADTKLICSVHLGANSPRRRSPAQTAVCLLHGKERGEER